MRTRAFLSHVLTFAMLCGAVAPAAAGPTAASNATTGTVTGEVVDQQNGLPISGADVNLTQGDTLKSHTKSDDAGKFAFNNVSPGLYTILVQASGFEVSRSREFVAVQGTETTVDLAINRASAQEYKTIGAVHVSASNALASTTTISRTIDVQQVQKENNIRLVDALYKLPGVNGQGLSSSVGDDTYLNIRGLGTSETQALLDGHPIGPQGVYGINQGGGVYPGSFNYADTPFFGISKAQVTFGSGASGLYGVDAIGGSVDLETLATTNAPRYSFTQGVGSEGRMQSVAQTTGALGRLSYAFAAGSQGTYGMFAPGLVPQTGRPNNFSNGNPCLSGNDISQCNLQANTYSVSQNVLLKAGLAKLRYGLSNNTSFTATMFASGHQADSTGNGDNDNIPYDTRLALIQNNPGNCALPTDIGGATSGYNVIVGNSTATTPGATACYTPQQWAAASNGPFGGGNDRNRGTNVADYHFRLSSTSGRHTITADGFYDHFKFYKSSEGAGGQDPATGLFVGTAFSQFLDTEGWLASDDIVNENSDIGFGYFGETQLGTRLNYNVNGLGLFNYNPAELTHYRSGFARGNVTLTPALSLFSSFWVKSSSVDRMTSFDPRVSLVLRPDSSDVVRATFGHSTGDPAAELASTNVNITGNPSSLNPSCTPFNSIAVGGNPNIRAERANDYEVGYAHKFQRDSSIQLNLYYTAVGDQLFSALQPLTAYGNLAVSQIPATILQGYASKIASAGCAGVDPANPASVFPYLAIATTFNANQAVSKGIELSGRQRLTPQFFVDYSYDLQSAIQNGIGDNVLRSNPFIINGAQIQGIPINQSNIGLDWANRGTEIRMDGYFIGSNNNKERAAYNTWDGFVSKDLDRGFTLSLGVSNIFNQDWQTYGYFGHQQFIPENHFFSDTNSIQQYVSTGQGEVFGLPVRSFSLSFSRRV